MNRKAIVPLIFLTAALVSPLTLSALFPPILEAQHERLAQRQGEKTVSKLPDKGNRYALVVGVDEYQDQEIAGLKGAANDARLLAKALIEHAGFDADNVKVLATGEPLSRQPNRGNILGWLNRIQSSMPKDGLLLFSFAGHGMDRDNKAFLLPTDAQISGDLGLLEDTSINVEAMSERIRRSGIKQVMLILDACRNNPEGRGVETTGKGTNTLTNSFTKGFDFESRNQSIEAFVKLYSTSVGELAYEDKEKRQGYFTYALVEGLNGAAAKANGEVTLADLVKYVQEQVPKRITSDYGKGKSQRPWAETQGYKADELVLSITIRVQIADKKANEVDPAAVELAFWESMKNSNDVEDFKDYLGKYPNGTFAGVAQRKIRQLEAAAKTKTPDDSSGKVANNPSNNGAGTQQQPSGFTREDNVAFSSGTMLRYFPLRQASPQECEDACAREPQCVDYTLIKPGAYNAGDPPMCYLHSTTAPRVSHPCCISGVKGGAGKRSSQ